MKILEHFLRVIDAVNEKIGRTASWLFIPLGLVTIFEVVARYVFNSPTMWAWDVSLQIFGAVMLLGGGYTLLRDKHVRIDVALIYLPKRWGLVLELMAMLLLMFVAVILVWQGGMKGWEAFSTREVADTVWAPPIYHIKMLFPVAGLLFFLQGLSKFTRAFLALLRGDTASA